MRFAAGLFSRNAVDEIIAPTVDSILTTGRGELVSLDVKKAKPCK